MRSTAAVLSLVLAGAASAADLSGTYVGQHAVGTERGHEVTMAVRHSGDRVAITTVGSPSGTCHFAGKLETAGGVGHIDGEYACTDGTQGPFALRELDVGTSGFTGRFVRTAAGGFEGCIGGTRTDAAHAGWEVNLVEQGQSLLATLRVDDAQTGERSWYSAAPVAVSALPDGTTRYTGPVYESTGPYLERRKVGKVTVEVIGRRTAWVDLTIDDEPLPRKLVDRLNLAGFVPSVS